MQKETDFRELFRSGRLVTDGAMGTYYREIYGGGSRFPELDNVAAPEKIEAIHREYIRAGADILRTNSFASNTETLSQTWGRPPGRSSWGRCMKMSGQPAVSPGRRLKKRRPEDRFTLRET
ncbi:homocysteine S-methyltransferase family protein [Faecalicatena contorta]|uniref:homocysteine S-methyltransferase family protein n=1 Tax=Faecalicatena contorta TaxID=39482 RepID=UPI0019604C7C|nr:homocysteine S-methyltransferase family protein [Faecalicatena contorta]MBM6685618.1 homocysteine S-methyltransferase family protein [Faecalicatena contorta]